MNTENQITVGSFEESNNIKNSIVMSDSIDEIAGALSSAQSELGAAKKDQSGFGYNYSDLAQVIASSKDALSKNGLAVVQLVGSTNDKVNLTTILTHKSGQYFKSEATVDVISMKGCNAAQNMGASLSYLRRYTYQAIIGQPSEDNDASSSGFSKKAAPKKPEPKTETKSKTSFRRKKKDTESEGGDDDI